MNPQPVEVAFADKKYLQCEPDKDVPVTVPATYVTESTQIQLHDERAKAQQCSQFNIARKWEGTCFVIWV